MILSIVVITLGGFAIYNSLQKQKPKTDKKCDGGDTLSQYYDKTTGKCIKCKDTQYVKETDGVKSCVNCDKGLYFNLTTEKCEKCRTGTYLDEMSKKCIPYCETADSKTFQTTKTCPSGNVCDHNGIKLTDSVTNSIICCPNITNANYNIAYDEKSKTYTCQRLCPTGEYTYDSNGNKIYDDICADTGSEFIKFPENADKDDKGYCCQTGTEVYQGGCCPKNNENSQLIYTYDDSDNKTAVGCCKNNEIPSYNSPSDMNNKINTVCCNQNNILNSGQCCPMGKETVDGNEQCKTTCGGSKNCPDGQICVTSYPDETTFSCSDEDKVFTCGNKNYSENVGNIYKCINNSLCQNNKVIYDNDGNTPKGCCTDDQKAGKNDVNINYMNTCCGAEDSYDDTTKLCCNQGQKIFTDGNGQQYCCPKGTFTNEVCCSHDKMVGPDDNGNCCQNGIAQFTVDDQGNITKKGGETKNLCYDECVSGGRKVIHPSEDNWDCYSWTSSDGGIPVKIQKDDIDPLEELYNNTCGKDDIICFGSDPNNQEKSQNSPVLVKSYDDFKNYCCVFNKDKTELTGINFVYNGTKQDCSHNEAQHLPRTKYNVWNPDSKKTEVFYTYSTDINDNFMINGQDYSENSISDVEDNVKSLSGTEGHRIYQSQMQNCGDEISGNLACFTTMNISNDVSTRRDKLVTTKYHKNADNTGFCSVLFEPESSPAASNSQAQYLNPLDDYIEGRFQHYEANIDKTNGTISPVLCAGTKYKVYPDGSDNNGSFKTQTEDSTCVSNIDKNNASISWCIKNPNDSNTHEAGDSRSSSYGKCQEIFDKSGCDGFGNVQITNTMGADYKDNKHPYCPTTLCSVSTDWTKTNIWNPDRGEGSLTITDEICYPSSSDAITSINDNNHKLSIVNNRTDFYMRAEIKYDNANSNTSGGDRWRKGCGTISSKAQSDTRDEDKCKWDKAEPAKQFCVEPRSSINAWGCTPKSSEDFGANFSSYKCGSDDGCRKFKLLKKNSATFRFYDMGEVTCRNQTEANANGVVKIMALPTGKNLDGFKNKENITDYTVHISGIRLYPSTDQVLCTSDDKSNGGLNGRVIKWGSFNDQKYGDSSVGGIDDGVKIIFFKLGANINDLSKSVLNNGSTRSDFEDKYFAVINDDGVFTVGKYNLTSTKDWINLGLWRAYDAICGSNCVDSTHIGEIFAN